jgi:uncharacterized protein YukE
MLSGGAFAAVTVLAIVIGVFVLLVSKNWGPGHWKPSPPDPAVAALVGAVEDAVGALAGSLTRALPNALARAEAGVQQIPAGAAESWGPTVPQKSCGGHPGCSSAERCGPADQCQQSPHVASWAADRLSFQKKKKAVTSQLSSAQSDFGPLAEAVGKWTGDTSPNYILDQQDNVHQLYGSVQKLATAVAVASDQLGQIRDEWGRALQNANVSAVPASMEKALDSVTGAKDALAALGGEARTAGGGLLMAQYGTLLGAYQRLVEYFLMPSGLSPPGFGPPGGR